MRLAVQLGEKMRDLSHVWAPPIYRRLTSLDKRERDISERCLLKSRSLIVPPPLKLSKVLIYAYTALNIRITDFHYERLKNVPNFILKREQNVARRIHCSSTIIFIIF